MRSATSPVHPVWCVAPNPAPLSPWKYSLNTTLCARSADRPAASPRSRGRAGGRRGHAGTARSAAGGDPPHSGRARPSGRCRSGTRCQGSSRGRGRCAEDCGPTGSSPASTLGRASSSFRRTFPSSTRRVRSRPTPPFPRGRRTRAPRAASTVPASRTVTGTHPRRRRAPGRGGRRREGSPRSRTGHCRGSDELAA